MSRWKDWANTTSWHGVADLYRAGSVFTKITWSIILLVTTFMFASQIYVQCKGFISNDKDPWVQTVTLEKPSSIPLPIITVCNNNRASKRALERLNMSTTVATYIVRMQNVATFHASEMSLRFTDKAKILEDQKAAFTEYLSLNPDIAGLSLYDLSLLISPRCNETMFRTSFMDINIRPGDLCNSATIFFNPREGICYSFKPIVPFSQGQWRNQSVAGELETMIFRLSIGVNDYAELQRFPQITENGASVYIGFDALGSTLASSKVAVHPGTHLWIPMQFELDKPPDTSSNPIFSWTFPELSCKLEANSLILDTGSLTSEMCYKDCIAHDSFKVCGCEISLLPLKNETEHHRCDIFQAEDCVKRILSASQEHDIETNPCLHQCKKSVCSFRKITKTSTYTKSPSNPEDWAKSLKLFYGVETDREQVETRATINIYYEQIFAKVFQYHLRLPIEQLISNIGGQLGLWAGISIITLYQGVIYVVLGIGSAIRGGFNKPVSVKPVHGFILKGKTSLNAD